MFNNKPLAALVALACSPLALAANTATLDEVVVTATRTATPVAKVLSDITVLGREEIEQSAALSLPQLLAQQAAVEMANNGGEGKGSSLFIRGANANHTLVLVDGVRIVSATLGTTALEHIPLAAVERVEILRGPASSLYGADAIGGVVQIFTKRGEGVARFAANLGVGDKSKRVVGASISGKLGRTGYSLAFDHNETTGFSAQNKRADNPDWAYVHNPDRDGYNNTTYLANVQHELAAGHSLGLNLYQTESVSEYDFSSAKPDESQSRLAGQSLELKNRLGDNWQSSLRYNYSTDKSLDYTNGNFNNASSYFETRQDEWLWQNDLQLAAGQQATLGINNTRQHVLSTTKFSQREREVNAAFAAYQGEFGAHRLQGSLRHDDSSQFGGKSTGQLGYGFVPAAGWLLRAAYGTAFKAPSINDLYFPISGNPALRPESARNREASVQWQQGAHRATLTYFNNRVDDLIEWVEVSNWNWRPFNVKRAKLEGYSLDARTQLGELDLSFNLTSQQAKDVNESKQLNRRAKLHGGVTAAWQLSRTRLSAELQASGSRKDSDGNGGQVSLAGYGVVNLGADYQLDKAWTASAKLSNVGDKVYETAKGYNQPRRGWFVGVRYAQ